MDKSLLYPIGSIKNIILHEDNMKIINMRNREKKLKRILKNKNIWIIQN